MTRERERERERGGESLLVGRHDDDDDDDETKDLQRAWIHPHLLAQNQQTFYTQEAKKKKKQTKNKKKKSKKKKKRSASNLVPVRTEFKTTQKKLKHIERKKLITPSQRTSIYVMNQMTLEHQRILLVYMSSTLISRGCSIY